MRPRPRRRLPAVWIAVALVAAMALLPVLAQDLPGQLMPTAPAAAASAAMARPQPGRTFVMAAFPATSQDRLSVFTSEDGVTYTTLASEAYKPPQGLLRDPSIIRADDGSYVIVYTTGWSGTTFGIARSADLRHWQHVADITVPLPGITNVWAPEWFRDADGSLAVVVSLSTQGTGGPFSAHYLRPLTADFKSFSAPRPLQGLDRNPIDTFVIRDGARYVAFAKNESSKFVERAVAASLDGPWTYDRTGDWAGWGGPVEGQSLVAVQDAQGRRGWRIHLDDYTAKRYRYADSFDGLQTWTAPRELGGVSGAVRHFTVLAEDSAALQRATAPKQRPQAITWDRHSLRIDGRREVIFAAEFHPFRLPSPGLWRDVLQKFKAAGLNTVSVYFSWGYHSAEPGQFDFSGVRNIERLLQMAAEEGLYVIARPGPYVNAELAAGGYPGWLTRQRAEARTDAADYQAAAGDWLRQVNAIIARHQITTGGGTVIAYQIENELFALQPKNARHMQWLADRARADGITVPLFHNAASRLPDWTPRNSSAPYANPGPTDIYAFDGYPGGPCRADGTNGAPNAAPDWGFYSQTAPRSGAKASPNTPGFVAEMGGGWFDPWGSNGNYGCIAERLGTGYQRVFIGSNLINGLTIQSLYMGYGGTTWGWQPAPVVYTSYDYGAPISEARALRDKAHALKLIGHFVQAAMPVLAQMDPAEPLRSSNPRVQIVHNVNRALGSHVLLARQQPSSATGTEAFRFELATADGRYSVPQAGRLQLSGQDARLWLAAYALGRQHLVYSTSELLAQGRHGEHDIAALHGRQGEDGETVLRYASRPQVRVIAGAAQVQHDAATGDLRLNYTHQGLIELLIDGGGRPPLRLLIADEPTALQLRRLDTAAGPVIAHSPALLRRAVADGDTLRLDADTTAASPLRLWLPPALTRVVVNDQPLVTAPSDGGLRAAQPLPGPASYTLPDLNRLAWTRRRDDAESRVDFNDSAWRRVESSRASAAQVYTAPEPGQPVLAMSDHGFHTGDVWYRGRFTVAAGAGEQQLDLDYGAGGAGLIQVWLDGRFIGQQEGPTGRSFPVTTGQFRLRLPELAAGEHIVAVMVRNNGHNWNLLADEAHKEARGLITASLGPRGGRRYATPIAWKIQGKRGGEAIADLVRGPYNNGGLGGEGLGWHLPEAPDRDLHTGWEAVSPNAPPPGPGTHWLRCRFTLDLPAGHDIQLGLAFGDPTQPRSKPETRVLIFLNGWNLGQFISHIGPQRVFVLPSGILNPRGDNTLALAVTTDGQPAQQLESLQLLPLHVARGGLPLEPVPQPRYLQR